MTDDARSDQGSRALAYRFLEILGRQDFGALDEVMHEDFVQDMPQSGERVRGRESARAIFAHFPGGTMAVDPGSATVIADEPRYVMTPVFRVVKVEGTGDAMTAIVRSRYPDGSDWYVINLMTVRDGKVARMTTYFAPVYPAPEWRRQWVEPLEPDGQVGDAS